MRERGREREREREWDRETARRSESLVESESQCGREAEQYRGSHSRSDRKICEGQIRK